MTSGLDTMVEGAIAEAAAASGLRMHESFDSADLPSVAGPFVTMNIMDAGGTEVVGCVAVRDGMDDDEVVLGQLVAAVSANDGSLGAPEAAGPVGTGADLSLRFTTPVTSVALTDGDEIQALIVTRNDRRGGGDSQAAAEAMSSPSPAGAPGGGGAVVGGLEKLSNVALEVSVELGHTSVTLAEVMDYHVGSIIELDRAAGSPVDIRVNGMLLAEGEVVLMDDEYAVRITAIYDPQASS